MTTKYTENLEEIATFGFEAIDPKETVEVNLKDLMYVFSTLQEFQQFFHQKLHYQTLEDVQKFMGTVKGQSAHKLLSTSIHDKMVKMLPEKIADLYDDGHFDSPNLPFYFDENRNK